MDKPEVMCADNTCPMRAACLRWLSIPAEYQRYADYAALRRGGSCPGYWYAGGYVGKLRKPQDVQAENERIKGARMVTT